MVLWLALLPHSPPHVKSFSLKVSPQSLTLALILFLQILSVYNTDSHLRDYTLFANLLSRMGIANS